MTISRENYSDGISKEGTMAKRKDECLFCRSRRCNNRVISSVDNGETYDEIACSRHRRDLDNHADRTYTGMKIYMETTGAYKRGELYGE